jgi:hypothetical protein
MTTVGAAINVLDALIQFNFELTNGSFAIVQLKQRKQRQYSC